MFIELLQRSAKSYAENSIGQLGASTAYYTVFTLAPFLVIVVSVAGILLPAVEVESGLYDQIGFVVGDAGRQTIESMVRASQESNQSFVASMIGVIALVVGASGLMHALQNAMNRIWKVHQNHKKNAVLILLIKRATSFGMVLVVSFLLLVSLLASTIISFLIREFSEYLYAVGILLPFADGVVFFMFITLLFAVMYRYLPDVSFPWQAAFAGALLAASLFMIGKSCMGLYLANTNFTKGYGIAGSVILLLLWINYSAQILFFGASFARQYALAQKYKIHVSSYAKFDRGYKK